MTAIKSEIFLDMQKVTADNGFFYLPYNSNFVLFTHQELMNHITRFSIPVRKSTGTVKCIEVITYA